MNHTLPDLPVGISSMKSSSPPVAHRRSNSTVSDFAPGICTRYSRDDCEIAKGQYPASYREEDQCKPLRTEDRMG